MEAKDTVMDDEAIGQAIKEAISKQGWLDITVKQRNEAIAQAQAEISFRAGIEKEYKEWITAFEGAGILIAKADTVGIVIDETRRAGIGEVVEWMKTYGGELYLDDGFTDKRYCITSDLWQAKLKEWGIK